MPLSPSSFFVAPAGVPFLMEDKFLRGGFRVVASIAERDAISLSSRKVGMRVLINDANLTEYQLVGGTGNSFWQLATYTAKPHPHLAADITDLSDAITTAVTAMRGGQDGLAYLASGKLAPQFVPAIAINDTYVVANETEMLALTASVGDVAVRNDIRTSYILQQEPASTLGNWQELLSPTSLITSVNGQTSGAVDITLASLGGATAVHGHAIADVADLENQLAGKATLVHAHSVTDVTGLQESLDGKAESVHQHDIANVNGLQNTLDSKVSTQVFTEGLAGKADSVHSHEIANVTGLQTALDAKADSTFVANALLSKADSVHVHAIADVTGLSSELEAKASAIHVHAMTDVTGLQAAFDEKASAVHAHAIADVTGLQTALDGKAASSHNHTIANVTGLQTALDGKLDKTGGTVNGNLTITGDVIIQGSSTVINTQELEVSDPIITVAKNNTTGVVPYAGMKVERGTADAFFVFNESTDRFTAYTSSNDLSTAGTLADMQAATFHGALNGNASSATTAANATKLATARAITLTGGASATGNFDGSAALSLDVTIADNSHAHTIANVTGLQTALDSKAASSHVHAIADVTGLQTALDGKASSSHTHTIANVTGLQTALDGKLATTGTAANSSQLQGLAGATAATANTVAVRDATGKITATDFTMTSDIRLKNIIDRIDDDEALNQVLLWESYKYVMKDDITQRVMPGFIAQQIQSVTSELVDDSAHYLSVSYALTSAYYAAAFRAVVKRLEKLEK